MKSLGFQQFKHIHMIGIGGSGMIGLATILQKRGFKVTGSDLVITAEVKELKKLGIWKMKLFVLVLSLKRWNLVNPN